MMSIEGNFDNPEVHELLVKHFIQLRSVSPKDSTHVLNISGLRVASIKLWSMWENDQLIGLGAIKFLNKEHGELKSIRVNDKFRNKRYGKEVIIQLIEKAKLMKIKRLSLETGAGEFFLPARKLFLSCGFKTCRPFSHYKDDVNSVYMSLQISN